MNELLRVKVHRDQDLYYHVVTFRTFMTGDEKSLCGTKPFPQRWNEGRGDGQRACPTCVLRLA